MKNKTFGLMLMGIMSLPLFSTAQIDKVGVNASLFHQGYQWKTNRVANLETRPGFGLNLNLERYTSSAWALRGGLGLQTFQVRQNLRDVPPDEYSPQERLSVRQVNLDFDFKRYFPGCGVHPYLVLGARTVKTFSTDYDQDLINLNENTISIQENTLNQWNFSGQAGFGLEWNEGFFLEGSVRRDLLPTFTDGENNAFAYQWTLRLGYYFKQASSCRKKRMGVISLF
ncbi:MAG: porin family protein [Bacteroidota bacterium]|nr:porin family protein [Bacteroidota bacterium]MDX5431729.1 porin family protein [Bacteroidota bacterium]MDX5470444.1 porin family protein [Bacteroidota bacterium]